MKKRTRLTILSSVILALGIIGSVQAEILPAHGEGQIGTARLDGCCTAVPEICESFTRKLKDKSRTRR